MKSITELIVNNRILEQDAMRFALIEKALCEATRVDRDDLFAMSFCYSPQPD